MVSPMSAPLGGVRVLDLTEELGRYATRLLRDLGAEVARVEPAGSPAPQHPIELFRAVGVRRIERGIGAVTAADVDDLLGDVALVVTDCGPAALRERGLHPDALLADRPDLVFLSISPFGLTGPDADEPASDVTLIAAGGLLALAGDTDRPPVRPFGEQAAVAACLHGTIGALLALRVAESGGGGQLVDVSAQECVAQAIENAAQYLDLEGIVRSRNGAGPREAGSGLFRCADGYVYLLVTMGGFDLGLAKVADWLDEVGVAGAGELREPPWNSAAYRATDAAIARFTELLESYTAGMRKLDLYVEGQRRGISIASVARAGDLVDDPQLVARGFFREHEVAGRRVVIPGSPYRFRSSDVAPRSPDDVPTAPVPGTRSRASAPLARDALADIRVADFTWVGAGPFLTKPLGDHGADVIKIESRSRLDPIRSMRPFRDGVPGLDRSGYFANRNSSKRSICLDLKHPEGLELARRLIANSDVVANNFSAGTMESLGLGYEEARELNPEVVYLDMPMQGVEGPHSGFRGYGLTIGAVSGFLDSTGWPDRAPVGTGTNFPDHVPNPLHAAIAVLAALRRRELTGEGEYIELAQLESTVNAIGPGVLEAAETGEPSVRHGNADPRYIAHGVYPTRGDDRWVAIAARDRHAWEALRRVLPGLPAADAGDREVALAAATAPWDRDELSRALRTVGVAASPVNDAADLLADPQLRARGHWVALDHRVMGPSVYDAPPYRLSRTPGRLSRPAPLLGADTRDVCVDLLGLSGADWDRLHGEGIIG